MKKGFQLVIFILFITCSVVVGQKKWPDEWINYSQKYFKISTVEDGIYRVSYDDLVSAGVPITTIDPKKIQIFHRGNEHAIYVKDQNLGTFDSNDYIEFYGKKNDGTLDEELYVSPEAQPHKYYNLYSDTTAYFLTWSLTDKGKRIRSFKENNVLNLPAETYHLNEIINLQTSAYAYGLHYPIGVASSRSYLSAFDHGEGWTGPFFGNGQYRDIPFSMLENVITTGTKPILEVLLTGGNNLSHNISIAVGADENSLRPLTDVSFKYHYDTLITETLEWSDISNGAMICRVSIPNIGVADRVSISYARLVFADAWDQQLSEQKIYHAKPTNSNRSYIEIQNVPLGAKLYDISDEQNIVDIGYNSNGADIDAVLENDSEGRKLLLTSRRAPKPKIEAVSMRKIDTENANFLIVTHKSLRKPTTNYSDVPLAYATYRASTAGGSFDTLLVNIDQLYNMFSYGEYTSLAMYRFCRFMAEKGNPGYLFIMGKGLSPPSLLYYRNNPDLVSKDLIPTGGFPGSDIPFTAGLMGAKYEAGFPVGRVAAKNAIVLEGYLDKVKIMESIPYDALWRKELVHLSGGLENIQDLLLSYVNGFKKIAEGEMLGGSVITFGKKTDGPTELINIAEQVNAGKLLITYFGHSAATTSDIDIGRVSNPELGFTNEGKYPMMIVNGCNAGDMYSLSGNGYAEDWIATPKKGAIGLIAHTNTGYPVLLNIYNRLFYEIAFTDSIFMKKGVGDIQKEVGRRFPSWVWRHSKEQIIANIQQMALQGDPSVSLFGITQPDYEISIDNIFVQSIDGEPINAFSEKFNLGLIVRNFGATHQNSLKITVKRTLSNGKAYQLDTLLYKPVYYQDTLYFEIKTVGIDGFGLNQFNISLDPANEVTELNESNNKITFDYKVPLGGTSDIFPTNYTIINNKETRLVAQSQDLLMDERVYLFELDTTILFNSPIIRRTSVRGKTIAKWTVSLFENLPDKDTLVFYWRTKFDELRYQEVDIWKTTSFTYINNGKPGWAMAHSQQFSGTETTNVVINPDMQDWEFEHFETKIGIKTFGTSHPDFDYQNVELWINNTSYIYQTYNDPLDRLCTDNSMNLVAFDKSNTVPYLALEKGNIHDILDRQSCGSRPQMIGNMLNYEIESQLRMDLSIDAIADGDYVLLFSIGNVTYQSWPASTLAKLGEIGVNASDIQSLSDGEPIIILGKKGEIPGSATIVKADYSNPAPAEEQEIMLDQTIIGQPFAGKISSPRIGPAAQWISFHQKTELSEVPATDDYSFNIYGIDHSNNEILLNDFVNVKSKSVDIQSIDSILYPFIRLEMNLFDDVNLTPPQLKNWIVNFEGMPEGVLSFKPGQEIVGNEKKEGEIHKAVFAFENVSDLAFTDSLAIEYSLFNIETRNSYVDTLMIKPLNAEESIDIPLFINTLGKSGNNDFKVFANPYIQAEYNYNNNYINIAKHLTVVSDHTNPIMELTVDGEFIMDGDIVSPTPLIVLRMKDENSVLLKEDTLGIHLYLNEKCEQVSCQPTRVSFSSPNLIWTPASAESDFMVEYRPQNLSDGIYTIRAEAADASGNSSGAEPYVVSFEIINESQITNFFPYPNPFSTRTQFVFTLTGSEIPDEIIIQIMTINGTVVREITQDEIGPIKIGHNKTEYAWDGRDEYGDQLANGVYLYKVKIFNSGKEMKHRETSADRAFKNGIGKMYLLR